MTATGAVVSRALFVELFDDAALFPPGNAAMPAALAAHLALRSGPIADLVGPFICPHSRVDEVPADISLGLIVPKDPAVIESVVRRLEGRLAAIEVSGVSSVGEADAAVLALRRSAPANAMAFVEVPRGSARPFVLDALVGTACHAKIRTGGTVAAAFPDETELAAAIIDTVARQLSFKCTAGLHHAVRHTADNGFEHHGFLNVLAATAAAVGGAGTVEVAELLAQRSPHAVAGEVRALGDGQIAATRNRFRSFGTCSIWEPFDDLSALGLLRGDA